MEEIKVISRDPSSSEHSSTGEVTLSQESEQPVQRTVIMSNQGTDHRLDQGTDRRPEERPDQLYKPDLKVSDILISAAASQNMCRICLSTDRELDKIKYPALAKVLRVITGQELDPREGYYPPGFACTECNDLIDAFSTFRCDARIANLNLMSGIRYVAGIAPDPETWESD